MGPSEDAESSAEATHAVTLVMPRMDLGERDDPAVEPVEPTDYDLGVESRIDDWVRVTVPVEDGEFVLASAREQGYWLPATCQQGWCTTCGSRLLSGEVDNSAARRYYDVDREEGWVLPCTARAVADCTIQTHLEPEFGDHRDEHDLPP